MLASSWSEGSDGMHIEPDASEQHLIPPILSGCSKQRRTAVKVEQAGDFCFWVFHGFCQPGSRGKGCAGYLL